MRFFEILSFLLAWGYTAVFFLILKSFLPLRKNVVLKVFRERELNLCCVFLWRFKRVPVLTAGTLVILAEFEIARLMQGCGKVNARFK